MGIYGALSGAVTGLRAQAHALENISGNIANSQTTGYKRIETDFLDLIPDAPISRQVPGAVLAQSRGTNDVQGDIKTVSNETFIALNSNGFFVVEPKIGQSDGDALFAGTNFFTRRGDFEIDKDGMLVNGAGYYLKGLPIDAGSGNISGSVPEVIRLSNAFLPANATKSINYQANLPQLPKTSSYKPATPHSELIKPWSYANPSPAPVFPTASGIGLPNSDLQLVPARAIGSGGHVGDASAAPLVNDGDHLTTTIGGSTYNLWFDKDGVANSAVNWSAATGSAATRTAQRIFINDADLVALRAAGSFYLGSTHVSLSSTPDPMSPQDLSDAIASGLGTDAHVDAELSGHPTWGRSYYISYPSGVSSPASTTTGTGVTLTTGWPAQPAVPAQTSLAISEHDIVGLHRSTEPFVIGGVAINFAAPAYSASKEGLLAAITDAFAAMAPAGTTVSPSLPVPPATLPPGPLNLTITYPPGYHSAHTVTGGISTNIDATGDIDTMLASMQTQLRDLTGDNTLFVKLKNGEITVSAGPGDANPLDFSGIRTGAIGGDILGLATGPYDPIPGSAMTADNSYADLILNDSDKLVVSVAGTRRTYSFDTDGRQTPGADEVEIDATGSLADMLAAIQDDLRANGGPAATDARVTYADGGVRVAFPGNYYYDATISGSAATKLGIAGTYRAETGGLATILASDGDRFISESISGGAITVYAENGAPANVQLRWAKLDSGAAEGQDTWNLYYLSDSNAQGASPMWTNTGQHYVFGADGSLVPPGVSSTTISNLTVNGMTIGDVELRHDTNGMSQFADVNGAANVSTLNQNGYGAGEFVSVAINDNGRVVATYSNGERIDVAQVVTAEFNAINQLKRLDGGVFAATSESGEAILDLEGSGIIGGALEASNTDISDEFTKLIVTQQAYAAGTRIVSAADEMLQESLNMVR